MSHFQFREPVILKAGDNVVEVRDALQASQALAHSWPETRGKWYYAANRACRSAVKGETSATLARDMFKAAVDESRIGA